MLCDCFKKIGDLLDKQGYLEATINNAALQLDFKSGKSQGVLNIPYRYKKKNRDGDFLRKDFLIDVKADYCPHCGKKLSGVNNDN